MALNNHYDLSRSWYNKAESSEDFVVVDGITDILNGIEAVEKGSLFSKNEELDDISTFTLKVFFCFPPLPAIGRALLSVI